MSKKSAKLLLALFWIVNMGVAVSVWMSASAYGTAQGIISTIAQLLIGVIATAVILWWTNRKEKESSGS